MHKKPYQSNLFNPVSWHHFVRQVIATMKALVSILKKSVSLKTVIVIKWKNWHDFGMKCLVFLILINYKNNMFSRLLL